MPPEILALVDKPHLLVLLLGAGAIIGMAVEQLVSKQRRAQWRERNAWRKAKRRGAPPFPKADSAPKAMDAADQLRVVMSAKFRSRPVLNRGESRVFDKLQQIVSEAAPHWRVMAQVSLGEILAAEDPRAYGCVNSKRVDLLFADQNWQPLHVIEYQGDGHHQGTAAARDAVKKEALRQAGIGYVEIVAGDTPSDLKAVIQRLVGRPASKVA